MFYLIKKMQYDAFSETGDTVNNRNYFCSHGKDVTLIRYKRDEFITWRRVIGKTYLLFLSHYLYFYFIASGMICRSASSF